jgi:hypothetical protein
MAIESISAVLTILKRASSAALSLHRISKDAAVNKKAVELTNAIIALQKYIMSVQAQYAKVVDAKRDLEKKLMEAEDWSKTQSHYDLKKLRSGFLVRSPNKLHPSPQPLHWLCANCYDKKNKSVLQPEQGEEYQLVCPQCNLTVELAEEDAEEYRAA